VVNLNDFEEASVYVAKLKEKNDAILLVHNYQIPWIQDSADVLGDSLALAMSATKVKQKNIVFCGVDFMAESAKVLNPSKRVVHPNPGARCPMAAMVDVDGLKKLQAEHPDAATVTYVNTTAAVKAISDVCCTSGNAVRVVKSMPNDKIIFVPDANLGLYVKRFVKDKEMIFWPGYCHVHQDLDIKEIKHLKAEHPDALFICHPECVPEVIDMADEVASTEGMVKFVRETDAREIIVGTEKEMIHRLSKEAPGITYYPIENAICPAMKQITFQEMVGSLETLDPGVELPGEIIEKATKPLERMLEIGRG
jgi:quinolinate synthase